MVKKPAQFRGETGSLRGRGQSFVLDSMITRSGQILGNLVQGIYDFCVGLRDELLIILGFKQYASVPVQTQAIYLLTTCDDDEVEISSLTTALSPQATALWQVDHNWTEKTVSPQSNDIFIDIKLPQLPADQLTTTDIAIPILLPPTVDPNFASQFFNENFKVMLETDSPDHTTELCVVDHRGQVLFSSNPDLVGTRPVGHQLVDFGRDKQAFLDKSQTE